MNEEVTAEALTLEDAAMKRARWELERSSIWLALSRSSAQRVIRSVTDGIIRRGEDWREWARNA